MLAPMEFSPAAAKKNIFKFGKVEMAPKIMKKTLTFCPLAKVAYS